MSPAKEKLSKNPELREPLSSPKRNQPARGYKKRGLPTRLRRDLYLIIPCRTHKGPAAIAQQSIEKAPVKLF